MQLHSLTPEYLQTGPQVLNKDLNTDGKGCFIRRGADAILFSLSLKNPSVHLAWAKELMNQYSADDRVGAGKPKGIPCVYMKAAF